MKYQVEPRPPAAVWLAGWRNCNYLRLLRSSSQLVSPPKGEREKGERERSHLVGPSYVLVLTGQADRQRLPALFVHPHTTTCTTMLLDVAAAAAAAAVQIASPCHCYYIQNAIWRSLRKCTFPGGPPPLIFALQIRLKYTHVYVVVPLVVVE